MGSNKPGPESYWHDKFERLSFPEPNSGCWIWMGYVDPGGYGKFRDIRVNGHWVTQRVHVYSYLTFVGPIPAGLEIDHRCGVRCCCNPNHLRAVTGRVNTLASNSLSAQNAKKTHCKHGHEFTEANTLKIKPAKRKCRKCARVNRLAYITRQAARVFSSRAEGNHHGR